HDGRGIRIHEDDAVALLFKCLAGLRPRIIEFARLADDDRAGANDQDAFDICTFWHEYSSSGDFVWRWLLPAGPGPELLLEAPQHEVHEAVEHRAHFLRTRARLGMPLEAECRFVDARDALQRPVEQRAMRGLERGRQIAFVDREAVILA